MLLVVEGLNNESRLRVRGVGFEMHNLIDKRHVVDAITVSIEQGHELEHSFVHQDVKLERTCGGEEVAMVTLSNHRLPNFQIVGIS